MNKNKGAHAGHNGTPNGVKGKKLARIERRLARGENTATPQERIASLDARGLVAKRERKRLERKISALAK